MFSLFELPRRLRREAAPCVSALVAFKDPDARRAARQTIISHCPASVIDAASAAELHRSVSLGEYDLIVADAALCGHDGRDLVEQVRFGQMHSHPFPVIFVVDETVESNTPSVHDCADGVLPLADWTKRLPEHLQSLTSVRRPFVVTPGFVGPERRSRERPGRNGPETIEVPNPLAARAGGMDEGMYRRAVSLAAYRMSLIRRCQYMVSQARLIGQPGDQSAALEGGPTMSSSRPMSSTTR